METTFDLLSMKLIEQAKNKRIPILGVFELTDRCNLNCKMCYIHNSFDNKVKKNELTAKQWIKLASDALNAGLLFLILTGGEVLVRKDFGTIYENIAQMGFSTTIYTNASLVTKDIAKQLGKMPPSEVLVTIYGASPETYYQVCGNAVAYEKTVKGIDLLIEEGINVDLRTTIIRDNTEDYEKLAEFAYKRGISLSVVNYISPSRTNICTIPMDRLSPEEFAEFGFKTAEINSTLAKKYAIDITDENVLKCRGNLIEELRGLAISETASTTAFECAAGSCDFWMCWDGKMVPCGLLDEPAVYPLEKGFQIAWKDLLELTRLIPACNECIDCSKKEFCMACPARLKCETGYFDKPAKYLCDLAEQVENYNETIKNYNRKL